MRELCVVAGLAALVALTGCKSRGSGGAAGSSANAVVVDEASRKEAQDIFSTRCTVCHGPAGEGNGPASAGLTPKPRNFHDQSWQTSVTDEHIEKIVQYGGSAVGKSAAMPPNPDLMSKPLVVAGLREKVRSFGK